MKNLVKRAVSQFYTGDNDKKRNDEPCDVLNSAMAKRMLFVSSLS